MRNGVIGCSIPPLFGFTAHNTALAILKINSSMETRQFVSNNKLFSKTPNFP